MQKITLPKAYIFKKEDSINESSQKVFYRNFDDKEPTFFQEVINLIKTVYNYKEQDINSKSNLKQVHTQD